MEKEILRKIVTLRKNKGYTQSDMAEKINISQPAYQKLESGENCTWAKYFPAILDIFELSPQDFFQDIGVKNFINQDNKIENGNGYIEKNYNDTTLIEKLLLQKDETIGMLNEQIAFLKKIIEDKKD